MRVTTQMLNETAKRTGIPVNQTSLLNYINNEESSSGSNRLLEALNKNSKVSTATTANSKKLQKEADSLREQAEKFVAKDADGKSFFDKIKESGETDELYKNVESYVKKYNSMLSGLEKAPGVLNEYYLQMLKSAASESSKSLEGIGIAVGKDGALSIDEEKLKAASVHDIEAIFGTSGTLSSKTGFLAGRVADNAEADLQSATSQYDASGNLFSQQVANRYDFLG